MASNTEQNKNLPTELLIDLFLILTLVLLAFVTANRMTQAPDLDAKKFSFSQDFGHLLFVIYDKQVLFTKRKLSAPLQGAYPNVKLDEAWVSCIEKRFSGGATKVDSFADRKTISYHSESLAGIGGQSLLMDLNSINSDVVLGFEVCCANDRGGQPRHPIQSQVIDTLSSEKIIDLEHRYTVEEKFCRSNIEHSIKPLGGVSEHVKVDKISLTKAKDGCNARFLLMTVEP